MARRVALAIVWIDDIEPMKRFELAFPCEEPADVDRAYETLLARGAAGVAPPRNIPWDQRAALIAEPGRQRPRDLRRTRRVSSTDNV